MILRKTKKVVAKTCDHGQTGAAVKAQKYLIHSMAMIIPEDSVAPFNLDDDHMGHIPISAIISADGNDVMAQGTTLSDLPNEIISHIFTHLDTKPPSQAKCLQRPDTNLTNREQQQQPLKQVSLVSRRFRNLSIKLLFQHCRLDPYYLTIFLSFVERHNLNKSVTSLTATLQGPCSHIHPAWWARLLNNIPLTCLTILAAPHVFSELIGTQVDDRHAWAFNMPYQTLSLTQSRAVAAEHIDYNRLPNLLTAKPWHALAFNEGSSLLAYSTYEYFLKQTPSLLSSWPKDRFVQGDQLYANLESFSFVAIFPFYNHVDEILKCVRQMKNLRKLFLKLCPEPDSTVLNDEIELARGHIDVNDPWNEFDTAYHLVAHSVRYLYLEGCLEYFHVNDVKMTGIRDSLVDNLLLRLQGLEGLKYDGKGSWYRSPFTKNETDRS